MSVDFPKLRSFVKIVDTGSISRASGALRTAQPALSQQIASLEAHFKKKLLIRSNRGIAPTEAGLVLYQHAQTMLKQLEQAQSDMRKTASAVSGRVSIGLGTYCALGSLSLPLLLAMQQRYPQIRVNITDSFGYIISEAIMTGRMDLAMICGAGPIKGVTLQPIFQEELFLAVPQQLADAFPPDEPVPLRRLTDLQLLLPSPINHLRKVVDESLMRAKATPHIVAEIESLTTLAKAVAGGMGATILPISVIEQMGLNKSQVRVLTHPKIAIPVSMCVSDHLPLSEPALACRTVLAEVVDAFISAETQGVRRI